MKKIPRLRKNKGGFSIKKITALALLLSLLFLLPACQNQPQAGPMSLDKASLTQEEDNIKKLLNSGSAVLYDYIVDESAQRLSINTYRLDDQGEWQMVSGGGGIKLSDAKGRIALSQEIISYSTDAFYQPEQFRNKDDDIYAVTVLFSKEPAA